MTSPDFLSRRQWLSRAACGFGALALQDLVHAASHPLAARSPLAKARAKRVIFLFMQGGPSQLDLFDPKEFIRKKHGEKIDSPLNKNLLQVGTEKFLALAATAPVRPRGQSGMLISDLMPHLSSIADDICLLRGMNADNPQHVPAELQLHTGTLNDVRPSMGAWISYGLGTENRNLPSFVTIHPGPDVRYYGSAFFPAVYQGTRVTVPLKPETPPVENLRNASPSDRIQRARLDLTQRMNRRLSDRVHGDAAMEGMIEAMELAFRMQTTTPEIVDLSR